jgi:hypothetical protein
MSLALGTMTVPATIVAKVQSMAGRIVTPVYMTSQSSAATFAQSMQGSCLPAIITIFGKRFIVSLQHLGYLVSSTFHAYFW